MKLENLNYQVTGREGGPWIVFIHGLLGSLANWRRITPHFESDYSILTYDQRGHGKSFKPPTGYSPEDYAADLAFLMDALEIPKACIVGHSMGGRNAQCFAYLHPTRVEKLVIEDIGPAGSAETGVGLMTKLKATPVPFENKVKAKEYLMNEFGDPKIGLFLYNSIKVEADGRATWSFDLATIIETIERGRGRPRWHELEGLKVPTLVIRGEHSDELSVSEFARMMKRNSLVSGVEVAGAGHWVHFDKPDEFIRLVREFLKK